MRKQALVGRSDETMTAIAAGQRRCQMVGLGLQLNSKAGTARHFSAVVEHRDSEVPNRPAPSDPLKPLSPTGGASAVMKFAGPIIACPKTQVTGSAKIGRVTQ